METEKRKIYIEWKECYSVGNTVLDNQHKFIINIINNMYSSLSSFGEIDDKSGLFEELQKYTKVHFAYEEKLLHKICFPAIEEHLAYHELMRDKILHLKAYMLTNEDDARLEMFHFLKEWWLDHILIKDMAYSDAIKTDQLK